MAKAVNMAKAEKGGGGTKMSFQSHDWKHTFDGDDLEELLKPFGLFVYSDPHENDQIGFIVSDTELTDEQIAAFACKECECDEPCDFNEEG